MKSKKVWRYYCDHCKKSGCGKAAMLKHEASCCRNPGRVCRMCVRGECAPLPLPELAEHIHNIDALRKAADGCPACMLAAVMQFVPRQQPWSGSYEDTPPEQFADVDFKAEAARFWADVNDAEPSPAPDYCQGDWVSLQVRE